ncbi:N-acetylmuramic acid 6-phosphate etherase [Lederbergia citrea]|uniref:N-acetylmuramic acid 6-phosphate etherase n=1 Tax=Lederbergia citrea TaxID=2833581 RepID=A0A942ULD7_9BACI|nr:N-acetylmuramic acid 6-phosphate etherase [Lederbergia citrea]MBS4177961.1 N-acetylmuramic acid 6-phosphate etherase [Lederbergia citrea]MBS4204628.1 N-acetylmuramic acid 6-phosphate etherase [Lederbergia citrea]MBS4223525.1 N-acetylmuramic acid 6-phosphate etherase [Lederbergia citrea]
MKVNLSELTTEQINEGTQNLDKLSTLEVIQLMNEEDNKVIEAVHAVLPNVAKAIDAIHLAFKKGGRLFYIGAGTSGRLGILDAAECPPTFYTAPEMVQGIMAGGNQAVFSAVEGAEDDHEAGKKDLMDKGITNNDVVVGVAASGRTPYVMGALLYAKKIGAATIALSCNKNAKISPLADYAIEAIVGPEVLTGSTRLKAATAQKIILNMFSTVSMVKLGKTYGNLMVDLHPSNEKLVERARNMLMTITGKSYEEATQALNQTNLKVKPAIVMLQADVSYETAKLAIEKSNGFVHEAVLIALRDNSSLLKEK